MPGGSYIQSNSPGGRTGALRMPTGVYYMGCTLAPSGKYEWTVRVRRRCGLMSNYFDNLLIYILHSTDWIILPHSSNFRSDVTDPLPTAVYISVASRTRERLGIDDIILILQQNMLRLYGHMLRKEDTAWVKKCMEYEVQGSRPRRRPKRTWKEVVQKDCQARHLNKEDAMDRGRWKKLIKIDDDQDGG